MNLATIEMDQKTAAHHFAAYRSAVRERHSKEDEAIMRCYKALSKGQKIINAQEAIIGAGANADGLPKLAICRANHEWCYWHWGEQAFSPRERFHRVHRLSEFVLPRDTFPRDYKNPKQVHRHRAAVPVIPPQFRVSEKMGAYHVLWEAEWKRIPPVDPILLKWIGGPLFAVLAQWDLTEVERAVMAHRFVSN